ALAAAGVEDPVVRAAVLRGTMGLAVLAALAWVAWDRFRAGAAVWGLTYLALAALAPGAVLVSVRMLTENALVVPLAAGMVLLPRRPFPAGVLFALTFAVLFLAVFVIFGVGLAVAIDDRLTMRAPDVLRML